MHFNTIFDEEIEVKCAGCVVMDNSKFVEGRIYQTKLWDLSQDFEIALPGMVVLSPMRHVSNYADLTDEEHFELRELIIKCKEFYVKFFQCFDVCYTFYEKPNGHIHFVLIPLRGYIKIENKYNGLGELMSRADEFKSNKETMDMVVRTIDEFRKFFL